MSNVNPSRETETLVATITKRSRLRWIVWGVLALPVLAVGYLLFAGSEVPPKATPPARPSAATPQPAAAVEELAKVVPVVASPVATNPAVTDPAAAKAADVKAVEAKPAGEAVPAIEIGIAYGTEKKGWLEWAAKEFDRESPKLDDGRRIQINLIPMGSVEGAHAILGGDKTIHVWSPASRLYRQSFVRDWTAKYGKSQPIAKEDYLALTPMVVVMWKKRYEAFVQKAPTVSLKMIGYAMSARTGWNAVAGRPEWGHFKFGHTHPNQSNSGIMALILLACEYYDKPSGLTVTDIMSKDFLDFMIDFERGVMGLSNSTGNMMKEMVLKGPSGYDALLVYESVAIDYLKSAEGRWDQLQIIYPKYNIWNDNPYYILDTPWGTPAHQKAAEMFLKFLMSERIQVKALDHGFRPGDPKVSLKGPQSPFTLYQKNGLQIDISVLCESPSAEVYENLQSSWVRNASPR